MLCPPGPTFLCSQSEDSVLQHIIFEVSQARNRDIPAGSGVVMGKPILPPALWVQESFLEQEAEC